MITDYHIKMILAKMDELLDVQSAILSGLKRIYNRSEGLEQLKQTMEAIMDQEQNNTETVSQSVTIDNGHAETCSESMDKKKSKEPSRTQKFKDYRAAGGTLSWKKWNNVGMPLSPDAEPAK